MADAILRSTINDPTRAEWRGTWLCFNTPEILIVLLDSVLSYESRDGSPLVWFHS